MNKGIGKLDSVSYLGEKEKAVNISMLWMEHKRIHCKVCSLYSEQKKINRPRKAKRWNPNLIKKKLSYVVTAENIFQNLFEYEMFEAKVSKFTNIYTNQWAVTPDAISMS